jgi:hypothetical protein
MYNVPNYDANKFSFGPGRLFLETHAYSGGDPNIDIGAVRPGAELAISREKLRVEQGSPAMLAAEYVTKETVTFKITGIEWNMLNFAKALGAGELSETDTVLDFGGDMNVSSLKLKSIHVLPDGSAVVIKIWKAKGSGDLTLPFAEGVHEFPYTFEAELPLDSTTDTIKDWNGTVIATKKDLCKVQIVAPVVISTVTPPSQVTDTITGTGFGPDPGVVKRGKVGLVDDLVSGVLVNGGQILSSNIVSWSNTSIVVADLQMAITDSIQVLSATRLSAAVACVA